MLKNVLKFLALFLALICIFYFFRKIQNPNSDLPASSISEVAYEKSLPDDFHTFYNQFHTDSLFQLERIVFPLKGLANSSDSTLIAKEVLWQQSSWIHHKPFNSQNGTFERIFTNISGIVSEQISANNGMFTMEKRYAKLSGEWHLIYYQELLMHG